MIINTFRDHVFTMEELLTPLILINSCELTMEMSMTSLWFLHPLNFLFRLDLSLAIFFFNVLLNADTHDFLNALLINSLPTTPTHAVSFQ